MNRTKIILSNSTNRMLSQASKFFLFLPMLFLFLFPSRTVAQDATWFIDVTASLGLTNFAAGGIMGLDVNNDGYPDLISVSAAVTLYINKDDPNSSNPKDRIFVDETSGSGLNIPPWIIQIAAAADFNNDGNIDVITNTWYHNLLGDCSPNPDDGTNWKCHLLLGDGQGHFTLKANSGLEDLGAMSGTALPILDFNKDGNLDIFLGNHYTSWCGTPFGNFLMKGNGDGTFTNVTASSGINSDIKPLFGGNVADWNNDCNQDILTAPYLAAGYGNLWKNNGNSTFTDVAVTAGYNPHYMAGDGGQAMVPWAAMPSDYDNDGDIDFLVLLVHGGEGSTEGRSAIFVNGGAANNYSLVPEISRITRTNYVSTHHGDHNGWWLDFDNDGWQDLIIGESGYTTTDRMYFLKQNASHNLIDVTKELGFMGTTAGSIQDKIKSPTQMISMDYDQDGDDDFFKAPYYSTVPFLALRNDGANSGHYINIKLSAPPGVNKSCIGARVTVKSGTIKQQQDIYAGGGSFATQQSPFSLNFGLGASTIVDTIDVRWPDGSCSHTVVKNVTANKSVTIDQNGISSFSDVITLSNDFEIYPNPAGEKLIVTTDRLTSKNELEIKDLFGRTVLIQTSTSQFPSTTLDVSNLSPGVYLVTIRNEEGIGVKKFVKE